MAAMWMKANPEPRGQANENYGKSAPRGADLDSSPTRATAQQNTPEAAQNALLSEVQSVLGPIRPFNDLASKSGFQLCVFSSIAR